MDMKRGKLVLAVVTSLILAFAFTAGAAEFTMKFANPVSKEHSWGKAAEKFSELVTEATKGRVLVQAHHAGTLGQIRETLEMARVGTVDFVVAGTGHVTAYTPEMGITVLPYLWKDTSTMFKALDGPFGAAMDKALEKQGLALSGWWDNGFRHITNKRRPIMKPDDLKGLKIRCLPAKVHVAFFRELGAVPTPMGWTELYQALQSGVVDAQENPPSMVYTGKLHEVQKFYSLTAHVNEPGIVVVSKASLNKLPADLQKAIQSAAQKAAVWQRELNIKDNDVVMKKLVAEGLKINEVPAETIAVFRKAAQKVYPEAIEGFGPDGKKLVDQMITFNK
jgi:tripartite ATP-independent transporter DctP family solute receptor